MAADESEFELLQTQFEQCLRYAARAYASTQRPEAGSAIPYDQTAVAVIALGMFLAKYG